jgi:hypothetical protein
MEENSMIRRNSPALYLTTAVILLAGVLTGCGASDPYERVAVRGSVTLDGRALEAGRIVFLPQKGVSGQQVVGTITDGQYEIAKESGPVCGPHKVQIFAELELPYDIENAEAHAAHVARGGDPTVTNRIADKYNVVTILQANPQPEDSNRFDFEVASVRGRRRR